MINVDKEDHITYSGLNFGSYGDTSSIKITYSKHSNGGRIEIRLDGPDGDVIGEFYPSRTGGWDVFEEEMVAIDHVDGVHDLTFVGKDANWIMEMKSFELSETFFFQVNTDYKVDNEDEGSKKKDVQCTYDVVLQAFTEQVFNKYYTNSGFTAEDKLYDELVWIVKRLL
jgi:hypothetical protein